MVLKAFISAKYILKAAEKNFDICELAT